MQVEFLLAPRPAFADTLLLRGSGSACWEKGPGE